MYVLARVFKVEKVHSQALIDRFSKSSIVTRFDGFVKIEVQVSRKEEAFDVIRVVIYWKSKKDYYRFEGSPEHIESHRNRREEDKPKGILEFHKEKYDLVAEVFYEGK